MEALVILSVIALVVFIRLMAGSMDTDRVDAYIQERGGRIITKQWNPFGKGWFGERDSRIYELTYEDAHGNLHEATCKTSLFSGVYFTEDRIIQHGKQQNDGMTLQEENQQLRAEIERLRNQQQNG